MTAVARWISIVWALVTTTVFVSGFFLPEVATFEPLGRYIYVAVLVISIVFAVMGLMRQQDYKGK